MAAPVLPRRIVEGASFANEAAQTFSALTLSTRASSSRIGRFMNKHGFEFGSTVRSTARPDWGPGKVIRITGDTVQVAFRDHGTVSVKAAVIEAADDLPGSFGWPVVAPAEFRKGVERIKRGTFETRIDRKPFAMRVLPSGLEFTPGSGGARSVTWAHIDEVLAQYNAAGSLNPGHYTDLSRNASYILTLVDHLFPEGPTE